MAVIRIKITFTLSLQTAS